MATQRRPQDREPEEAPATRWEFELEQVEAAWTLASRQEWLQLVIAQQLRELILAIRPILKNPMIRRLIDNGNR